MLRKDLVLESPKRHRRSDGETKAFSLPHTRSDGSLPTIYPPTLGARTAQGCFSLDHT